MLLLVIASRIRNLQKPDTKHAQQAENAPVIPAKLTLIAGHVDGRGSADGVGTVAQFGPDDNEMGGGAPMGITSDASGNLYVADEGNHTIRKVTPNGVVTTIAGKPGLSGSKDGVGADARFRYPNSIAIDAKGNLFVTDTANYTIRKITPSGAVTTLAGQVGVRGTKDGVGTAAPI